jgi:hypothetical protein
MPFVIAYRHDKQAAWTNLDGEVYEDGKEAAAFAKSRNDYNKSYDNPTRYRVVPIPIEDPLAWRIREEQKFKDNVYTSPPWERTSLLEHVDPDDPTKVRFFMDDKDAHRNRYTSMNPARFYIKYIDPHPSQTYIDEICAKMGLDMTVSKLQLATTADEIERVYTSGPHSCMAYKAEKFGLETHPVRVYGDLDLAVAYIERAGEITGRCLVWPEKKIHGRIYGDLKRLKMRLDEEGYIENWDFSGARLHWIEENGRRVAPYVDGDDLGGIRDGDFIILTNEPHLILKSPDGDIDTACCYRCRTENVHITWHEDEEEYFCAECWDTE